MKTLCYSVRLESLVRISDKAFKATAFDGSSDIIPASQVFGRDYEVMKSDAYWISAWILEKKSIQYSGKKQAWFDENGHMMLKKHNWTNARIGMELGMDADEVLRLKQITGIAEAFKDEEFSKSWEPVYEDEPINP